MDDFFRMQLGVNSWAEFDNSLFFWGKMTDCIYRYDISTGRNECYCRLPEFDSKRKTDAFLDTCIYREKIYLSPLVDDRLCRIDIKTKQVNYYKITPYEHIVKIIPHENELFLIGESDHIICFDLKKESFSKIELPNKVEAGFRKELCIDGNKLYFGLKERDSIMEFNMQERKFQMYKIPVEQNIRYNTINKNNGIYWMTGDKKSITKWDKEDNLAEVIDISGYIHERETGPFTEEFSKGVIIGEMLMLCPVHCREVLKIDMRDGNIDVFDSLRDGLCIRHADRWGSDDIYLMYEYISPERCNQPEMDFVFDMDGKIIKKRIMIGECLEMICSEKESLRLSEFIEVVTAM